MEESIEREVEEKERGREGGGGREGDGKGGGREREGKGGEGRGTEVGKRKLEGAQRERDIKRRGRKINRKIFYRCTVHGPFYFYFHLFVELKKKISRNLH